MRENCSTCGNCSRKKGRAFCVTEREVDAGHVCDGWVRPCTSVVDVGRRIDRAIARIEKPGWQPTPVMLGRHYRRAFDD